MLSDYQIKQNKKERYAIVDLDGNILEKFRYKDTINNEISRIMKEGGYSREELKIERI